MTDRTAASTGPVRTLLQMRARAGCEEAFEREWLVAARQISRAPGNLRQDLLRSADDPRAFTVVSDWTDAASLEAFSTSAARETLTQSLRELREGAERLEYEVLHTLPGTPPHVRVLVTTLVSPGEEPAFEAAYLEVAAAMRGTPGHVREELLHEPGSPTYHLLAEWVSREAFLAWVQQASHTDRTGPMVPYLLRSFSRRIFDVVIRPPESPAANGTTPYAGQAALGALPDPRVGTLPGAARRADGSADRTDVLIVGAGPTGLTLALELARRGIDHRIIEAQPAPNGTADKAIGVHCRTMEIWADQGIVDAAIDRGIWLEGQIVTVNGRQTHRVEWSLPELPYAHLGLPQYETEDLLGGRLAELGGRVERGTALTGLSQDDDGVTATLTGPDGRAGTVRARYVVGCDGAHSVVRKQLGLAFEAGAGRFPQLFMLCDVEVDWDLPRNYLLRFIAEEGGELRGMLVCVPLKGEGRYRIATLAPPRLAEKLAGDEVPPGFSAELAAPTLAELQPALDRLAPPGTTARNLRWSSVFRINHGIATQYRVGRAFVAGDAAHLHPPAGGQGMNTGIQDAYNLGWKLGLVVQGAAGAQLLDSYQAERRPAAAAVVDRAVRVAFTDEMDFEDERRQFLHEMHLLLSYRDGPLVGEVLDWGLPGGVGAGDRAPDVHGLVRPGVGHPARLFEVIAGTGHTVLLYLDGSTTPQQVEEYEALADRVAAGRPGLVRTVLIAATDAKAVGSTRLPVYTDAQGGYREQYASGGPCAYVIRPDGHVGFRSCPTFPVAVQGHLDGILDGTSR